jgi:ankyrin repeat protein
MKTYIKLIKEDWKELSKLPKLSAEDIAKVNEPERMYLYAFNGYFEILYTYKIDQLSLKINKENDNLFLLAICKNNFELIEYLIANGFDIHYKNNYGSNAYLYAALNGHIETLKYLESRGLDIHLKNIYGSNAYLLAAYNCNIETLKHLESCGVYIHLINNDGANAYLLAAYNGHIEILKHLE